MSGLGIAILVVIGFAFVAWHQGAGSGIFILATLAAIGGGAYALFKGFSD